MQPFLYPYLTSSYNHRHCPFLVWGFLLYLFLCVCVCVCSWAQAHTAVICGGQWMTCGALFSLFIIWVPRIVRLSGLEANTYPMRHLTSPDDSYLIIHQIFILSSSIVFYQTCLVWNYAVYCCVANYLRIWYFCFFFKYLKKFLRVKNLGGRLASE